MKDRPLRLAVDAANLSDDRRGMGRLTRATLDIALADDTLDVTLLSRGARNAAALGNEFKGVRVAPQGGAARRRQYDRVWFPFNGMRFFAAAPALVTIHDAFAFTQPHGQWMARFREQQPIRRAARKASLIVTDSQWSRAEIERELGVGPERLEVVIPSPDSYWCPGNADALPGFLRDKRFALVVGAGEARKNASLALRACARALRGPDELLVVVGALRPADRLLARTLELRCDEMDAGDATLRALYRAARIVLVPSFAEGFGLVAVEALACGAAVLASNAAALPEATAGAAALLDPCDEEAWARTLRAFFDDDLPIARLRALALQRFTALDRTAASRRTLALLRSLARTP